MIETFGILIPFLIADVLNPVLFAFMVYAAGTQRPVVTSSAMLLGHTAAYFGAGIVIVLGLEKITHYLANPSSIDYLIALIVGLLLLWVAFPKAKKPQTKRPEDSGSMTPLSAFGLGSGDLTTRLRVEGRDEVAALVPACPQAQSAPGGDSEQCAGDTPISGFRPSRSGRAARDPVGVADREAADSRPDRTPWG